MQIQPNLLNEYNTRCNTNSDIFEHLPVLRKYAEDCEHVTEFGVWKANSSVGLLAGLPKIMRSYDIREFNSATTRLLYSLAEENGIDYKFIKKSSIEVEIDKTDFLFIDSLHMYDHLKKELELHHRNVSTYIGFHDTDACATSGMSITGQRFPGKGLMPAINEFIKSYPEWRIKENKHNNFGLLILKKRGTN